MTTTDDTTPQGDTTTPPEAGNTTDVNSDIPEDTGGNADDTDATPDDDAPGDGRRNREAHYRRRAQAAEQRAQASETETARLRKQITALQLEQVSAAARARRVDPRLIAAAGIELADLLDDAGHLDAAKVNTAIDTARAEFGRRSIGTGTSPLGLKHQGSRSGSGGRGLRDVVDEALGR